MSRRQKAIEYAEQHRAIHQEWVDHWRTFPPKTHEERVLRKAIGGINHHLWAIKRYNLIIDTLKELRKNLS